MKNVVRFSVLAAFTVLVAALLVGGASANNQALPFRGTWSGELTIVNTNCSDHGWSIVEHGTGYLEHMGKTAWYDAYCMDTNNWTAISRLAKATAANGDEMDLQVSLQLYWNPNYSGGIWTETETCIGGTGKFAAAQCNTQSHGTFTLTSQTTALWDGTTMGTLSY
jgi:hypothetical protein